MFQGRKYLHKYRNCWGLLLLLPQEESGPSCFHSSLANSRNRSFVSELSPQQRQEVPPHCPRSLLHPPGLVAFSSPVALQEPLQALQRLSALACLSLLQSKPIFYRHQCTDFREGEKNKLDIPGPAVPGVSQLWDGESSLLAGLFYYREVLDLM